MLQKNRDPVFQLPVKKIAGESTGKGGLAERRSWCFHKLQNVKRNFQ